MCQPLVYRGCSLYVRPIPKQLHGWLTLHACLRHGRRHWGSICRRLCARLPQAGRHLLFRQAQPHQRGVDLPLQRVEMHLVAGWLDKGSQNGRRQVGSSGCELRVLRYASGGRCLSRMACVLGLQTKWEAGRNTGHRRQQPTDVQLPGRAGGDPRRPWAAAAGPSHPAHCCVDLRQLCLHAQRTALLALGLRDHHRVEEALLCAAGRVRRSGWGGKQQRGVAEGRGTFCTSTASVRLSPGPLSALPGHHPRRDATPMPHPRPTAHLELCLLCCTPRLLALCRLLLGSLVQQLVGGQGGRADARRQRLVGKNESRQDVGRGRGQRRGVEQGSSHQPWQKDCLTTPPTWPPRHALHIPHTCECGSIEGLKLGSSNFWRAEGMGSRYCRVRPAR